MKTKTLIGAVSGLLIAGLGVAKSDVANFIGGGLLVSNTVAISRKKDTQISPSTPENTVNSQPISRVYIDGANTFGATRILDFEIDFKALANHISDGKDNVIFNFYFAVSDTPTYKEIGFINYLEKTGYNVVKSLKKQLPDGSFKNKGDDVQIATDIANDANENDHIILVSGDGDFTYSLEKVKAKGCQVTVVSTGNCLSSQLKNVADNVINLADLKTEIKR
jgi:uncharacterized LabA/DUF88 family protein